MSLPQDCRYSKEHEWLRIEGNTAIIGVTDFAQEQLGDIVMVEFPEIGTELKKDESFGVLESVKSVSDVFAPVSGKVLEVNKPLEDSPGMVNQDCYGEGWLVKIEISDANEVETLMDAASYEKFLDE